MKSLAPKSPKEVTQEQVTQFYDRMVFPSETSHSAYRHLVPKNLSGSNVGDFGCGRSLFIDEFRTFKCDAIFLDISRNALNTINYGKKIQASLTDLPLGDAYMDLIFCIGVVHHIPQIEKAIGELARVLKVGGRLYLGVYAHRSMQALLRKSYEYTQSVFLRRLIYWGSGLLIWLKNRKNNLRFGGDEHYKRIDDLFKTPLVRYLPPDFYARILKRFGCRVLEMERISSMNILIVEKAY